MTTSNAQQERQLLLMERMSGKIDSIVESQKKLEDANRSLQQENERLRIELQKKEKQNRCGSRISRRSSTLEIPTELRKRFRFIYKKLVEKKMSQGFNVEEDPQSERNQQIFTKIKEILRKEHGAENCPWTDLEMEAAQFHRYFKTVREREMRIKGGKNEQHKEKCKKNRRLLTKLERRNRAFELVQSSMSATQRQYASEVLYMDYMSSEESDYEETEDPITGERERKLACYITKKLPWEKTSLTSLKSRLDRAYHNSLSSHARAMSKPRQVGGYSGRPAPEGPSWAVRQPDEETA